MNLGLLTIWLKIQPETLIADVPKDAKDIVLSGMKQVDMTKDKKWIANQYNELKPIANHLMNVRKQSKGLFQTIVIVQRVAG